jgi:hypothetical protein
MAAHLGLERIMGQSGVFGISENNVNDHVTSKAHKTLQTCSRMNQDSGIVCI